MEDNYEQTEYGPQEVAVVGDADAVGELGVTYEEFTEMAEYVREHLHDTVRENGDRMRWYPWHSAEYRYRHLIGVVDLAERIAREEGADVGVVRVAGVFHDAAKFQVKQEKHAEEGAWIAQKYLSRNGFPDTFIDRVARVIRDHTREMDGEMPIESKVLIEADSIDKIGVAGATLMVMRVGYESRSHEEVPDIIERVVKRGERIAERIETETGKRIARERVERAKQFKAWFEDEI
ncbi:MAG: HD domain-containing protein [Halobacteriales archaeon]